MRGPVHTGRRVFRDTAWIWMLTLFYLDTSIFKADLKISAIILSFSTSGQELFPAGIISKYSFLAAIRYKLKRV